MIFSSFIYISTDHNACHPTNRRAVAHDQHGDSCGDVRHDRPDRDGCGGRTSDSVRNRGGGTTGDDATGAPVTGDGDRHQDHHRGDSAGPTSGGRGQCRHRPGGGHVADGDGAAVCAGGRADSHTNQDSTPAAGSECIAEERSCPHGKSVVE